MNNIKIRTLYPDETSLPIVDHAKEVFITYFTDLYKDISPTSLGISNLDNYLNAIFEKTKIAILENKAHAFLLSTNDCLAGFMVCSVLEDSTIMLIHTLPVALSYSNHAQKIRQYLLAYIQTKFSSTKTIIMLVRKANMPYRLFCENTGFVKNNSLFLYSEYLKTTYDSAWYDIYEFTYSTILFPSK